MIIIFMEMIARQKHANEYVAIADMTGRHNNEVFKNIILNSTDVQNGQTNVKAKMTDWNLSIDYPPFHNLGKDICENFVYDYFLSVYGNYEDVTAQKLIVSDMWGIVYNGNEIDHTVSHSHHWWHTSFVYYVDVGDDTSPLIFDDYQLQIKPENNKLILFDAKARHHVPPYKGSKQRIVIGGNIEVLKLDLYKNILKYEMNKLNIS